SADLHGDKVEERRGVDEVRKVRYQEAAHRRDDGYADDGVHGPPVVERREPPRQWKEKDVGVRETARQGSGCDVLRGGRSPDDEREEIGEDYVGEEVQSVAPGRRVYAGLRIMLALDCVSRRSQAALGRPT